MEHTIYVHLKKGASALSAEINIMNNNMKLAGAVGLGLVLGSAIAMSVSSPQDNKKTSKINAVGKAFKSIGSFAENIGNSIGM